MDYGNDQNSQSGTANLNFPSLSNSLTIDDENTKENDSRHVLLQDYMKHSRNYLFSLVTYLQQKYMGYTVS